MDITAGGTFEIESWEPEIIDDEPGASLGRVRITKVFHGDLKGTSTAHLLTVADGAGNPAVYVAVERFTGEVLGRRGSFVLHHSAPGSHGERLAVRVVPGTGTEDLTGLTGAFEILNDTDGGHSYTLEGQLG
ncbi:DUF3224 domain-containing protein [Kitasatospora atroaurantiaca]|uniref:Uncharacterized protein DUF3224 n=1 Tax=Kitasatospora atroaurantiaca TaxID=285545 RepID=A0A561F1G6_9ACTN|nr:DUF3224 domain-containing protein [Kitasatospora atroaurantiaca]TWE21707.1 uncharacterized protein DUF3224 [Kitasatospora atroaurantiaca]